MATASTPAATAAPVICTVGVHATAGFPDEGIREALGACGHEIAFWHSDPDAAVEACRGETTELLLLGAPRPDADFLELARALGEACESARAILVCERSGAGDVRKALDVGISAVVNVGQVAVALGPVIEVVRAGQVSVPSSRGDELPRQVLTGREKQILGQVVLGMTNAEIASKLFLAESTVKSHLSSAFAKLGVTSRNEAAALILDPTAGLGMGILTIPSKKVSTSA